jgi:WhiB family redox-sensing transcriptional regulator
VIEAIAAGALAGAAPPSLDICVAAPSWLRNATSPLPCLGVDPELFFPDGYMQKKQIDEAREICNSCPMRVLCLEWAVARPELDGIWAATTPPERRRLRTGKTT